MNLKEGLKMKYAKDDKEGKTRDPYLIVLAVMMIVLLYFYLKSKGIVP